MAVITNDIYTREDAEFHPQWGLIPRPYHGVETGGCPHTAIREDASINIDAVERMLDRFPTWICCLWRAAVIIWRLPSVRSWLMCRSMSSMCLGVIKFLARGPGVTCSDLLVINKIDLAPAIGADLAVMCRDAKNMRDDRPFVCTNLKSGEGVPDVIAWIEREVLFVS
jgi:urease accessory protein